MDRGHLESFIAVLDTGSVTSAARRAFVSQPALSRQIRLLEQACGTELFTRSKSGMVPTRAGRQLEPVARDLLARARSADRVMAALGEQKVPLTVACPTMVAELLVLPFVAAGHTPVADVVELPTLEIYDSLGGLSADLAMAPLVPPPSVRRRHLYDVPFSVQVPPDSPLAERDAIDVGELPDLPLLVPDRRSGTRLSLDDHLIRASVTIAPKKEVARTHIAQAMAAAGHGVVVCIDLPKYGLRPIPLLRGGERLIAEEWAAWPNGHYAEEAISAFLDDFLEWLLRESGAGVIDVRSAA
ncbi:LysR family transcriptional regulator [Nocardiopsis composta]|uniref:DNA-binding transcriptional LysR family regulator n=1 Tax=Nocardiopsis composta TaxID=157465 RepID=A0A7W8QUL3_9ACTN|nr:LysR family transcriptional regulator [Nocardiopsis composta]MBB5436260.1 DNA-binding transcriptional LysR family regulator [Nocardiopsis composta]